MKYEIWRDCYLILSGNLHFTKIILAKTKCHPVSSVALTGGGRTVTNLEKL